IETMSDPRELLVAAEAVRSVCKLPIVGSMTFSAEGETLLGSDVEGVYRELFGHGTPPFHVFGVNCGAGPLPVLSAVERIAALAGEPGSILLAAQPNAGLPTRLAGRYTYAAPPRYFA